MKVHFIGIGGIGVSALARYYLAKGFDISGSNLEDSPITQDLRRKGAKVFIGHNLPKDVNKVIYSLAVPKNNPELIAAAKRKIKAQSYPQALGELTKNHFTIAICGAHGKGTTTALISLILIKAGLDPTVIVGTNLKEFGNANFRLGKSKILVIEADEFGKAFLNYWPKIIVVTNIDKEHLDCYKDLTDIKKTFIEFFGHLPEEGILILNEDDENSKLQITNYKQIPNSKFQIKKYFRGQKEAKKIRKILKIPGEHNVSNALAALAVSRSLDIPDKISFKAIGEYNGAWRRFEISKKKLAGKPVTVISDYAHHPNEIKATLSGAREKFPKKKIWAIFQPHQCQRTYYLFNDFAKAFKDADEVVLTEIYGVAGREKKEIMRKVSGKKLAQKIIDKGKKVFFVKDFKKIPILLREKVKKGDVIVIMGAGSIYKIVDKLR